MTINFSYPDESVVIVRKTLPLDKKQKSDLFTLPFDRNAIEDMKKALLADLGEGYKFKGTPDDYSIQASEKSIHLLFIVRKPAPKKQSPTRNVTDYFRKTPINSK